MAVASPWMSGRYPRAAASAPAAAVTNAPYPCALSSRPGRGLQVKALNSGNVHVRRTHGWGWIGRCRPRHTGGVPTRPKETAGRGAQTDERRVWTRLADVLLQRAALVCPRHPRKGSTGPPGRPQDRRRGRRSTAGRATRPRVPGPIGDRRAGGGHGRHGGPGPTGLGRSARGRQHLRASGPIGAPRPGGGRGAGRAGRRRGRPPPATPGRLPERRRHPASDHRVEPGPAVQSGHRSPPRRGTGEWIAPGLAPHPAGRGAVVLGLHDRLAHRAVVAQRRPGVRSRAAGRGRVAVRAGHGRRAGGSVGAGRIGDRGRPARRVAEALGPREHASLRRDAHARAGPADSGTPSSARRRCPARRAWCSS